MALSHTSKRHPFSPGAPMPRARYLHVRNPKLAEMRTGAMALLRTLMTQYDVTACELARVLGVHESVVRDRLSGDRPLAAEEIALLPQPLRSAYCDALKSLRIGDRDG